MSIIDKRIDIKRIPQHVAIVMDGNGRWAKNHGQERVFGHKSGVAPIRACIESCRELGIQYLTLYAFSTENWNRPIDEVNELMKLLISTTHSELHSLIENEVKLRFIGDINRLYPETQETIKEAAKQTAHCDKLTVSIALSYSSRWEIVNAIKKLYNDVAAGIISTNEISDHTFSNYLETANIPDPSLLIRTGGEKRISNFLLWQIAYSELYFTDIMWPEFTKKDFYDSIVDYQGRERRFGKTSEQVKNK